MEINSLLAPECYDVLWDYCLEQNICLPNNCAIFNVDLLVCIQLKPAHASVSIYSKSAIDKSARSYVMGYIFSRIGGRCLRHGRSGGVSFYRSFDR